MPKDPVPSIDAVKVSDVIVALFLIDVVPLKDAVAVVTSANALFDTVALNLRGVVDED